MALVVTPGLIVLVIVMAGVGGYWIYYNYTNDQYEWKRVENGRDDLISDSSVVSPAMLAWYRLAMALWMITLLTWDCLHDYFRGRDVPHKFKFFTYWNYITLGTYFTLSAIYSLSLVYGSSTQDDWPTWRRAIWITYDIELINVLIVDIVLWSVLYPAAPPEKKRSLTAVTSIHMHLLNFFQLGGDFFMNRIPIVWSHGIFWYTFASVYMTFQWIQHAYGGKWEYFFLATAKPTATAWYTGLMIFFFGVWFGVTHATSYKNKWLSGDDGIRDSVDLQGAYQTFKGEDESSIQVYPSNP